MDDIAASSTFKVDYAASGRSKCNRCRQAIDEKELRIGPMVQSDKGDFKYPQWHHFHCFEDGWLKKNPGAMTDVNAVSGIDQLQFADQKKLKSLVVGGDSTLETKAVTGEEKKLAQENKLMWSRREKLEALSNAELASLLEHNQQPNSGKIFGGRMKMLERVSDAMTFGSLPKCSVCHNGDLYFSHGEYKCTGSLDEFAKCENRVTDIARGSFSVPNDIASAHKFLETFRFKARERTTAVMAAQNSVFANEESVFCSEEPSGEETHSAVARRKRERDEPSVDALKPFQESCRKLRVNLKRILSQVVVPSPKLQLLRQYAFARPKKQQVMGPRRAKTQSWEVSCASARRGSKRPLTQRTDCPQPNQHHSYLPTLSRATLVAMF
jgi:hypothetical protein